MHDHAAASRGDAATGDTWEAALEEWLQIATGNATTLIEMLALAIIVFGTIEAFVAGTCTLVASSDSHRQRDVWLRYGRWLVAGLTFQLAVEIIELARSPDLLGIARIAALAGLRTFLDFFLEHDLGKLRAGRRET